MFIRHHFSDGLYTKECIIPAGDAHEQHVHKFSHQSILAQGHAVVVADGVKKQYSAPACIEIKAGVVHKIGALTDVVWYCIHATDSADPDSVDRTLIAEGSN